MSHFIIERERANGTLAGLGCVDGEFAAVETGALRFADRDSAAALLEEEGPMLPEGDEFAYREDPFADRMARGYKFFEVKQALESGASADVLERMASDDAPAMRIPVTTWRIKEVA